MFGPFGCGTFRGSGSIVAADAIESLEREIFVRLTRQMCDFAQALVTKLVDCVRSNIFPPHLQVVRPTPRSN